MRLPQRTIGKVLLGTAVVLVLATGTTYAAATIGSGDIVNGSIRSIDIKNGTVAGVDIKNESVKSNDIRTDAVTTSEVLDGTLTGADVADGTLTSDDVADGSLTSTDILNGTLTGADVADGSLTGADVSDNSLTEADLAAGSVTTSELGTITKRSAVSANIPANGNGSVTANCNAGEKVLTGGNDGFFDVFVVASRDSGNGWTVFAKNTSAGNRTITAHVYCLAP